MEREAEAEVEGEEAIACKAAEAAWVA